MALRMLPCGGSVTTQDSSDGLYRVRLIVGDDRRTAVFVLAFPVDTSGTPDDPAERRCAELARAWGFGMASIIYLIPHRQQHLKRLRGMSQLHSPSAHHHINRAEIDWAIWTVPPGLVVAAWGDEARQDGFDAELIRWLDGTAMFSPHKRQPVPVHCLGVTAEGSPIAPLDAAGSATPSPFNPPSAPPQAGPEAKPANLPVKEAVTA